MVTRGWRKIVAAFSGGVPFSGLLSTPHVMGMIHLGHLPDPCRHSEFVIMLKNCCRGMGEEGMSGDFVNMLDLYRFFKKIYLF